MIKDKKKIRFTANIFENDYNGIVDYCNVNDITVSNHIRKVLKQYVDYMKIKENEND